MNAFERWWTLVAFVGIALIQAVVWVPFFIKKWDWWRQKTRFWVIQLVLVLLIAAAMNVIGFSLKP